MNKTELSSDQSKMPYAAAVFGLLVGLAINLGGWSLVGDDLVSKLAIAGALAFVFYRCGILWLDGRWKPLLSGPGRIALFALMTLFNTFVWLYDRLVTEKLAATHPAQAAAMAVVYFVLIALSELCLIQLIDEQSGKLESKGQSSRNRGQLVRFFLITFAVLCAVWGVYLYAAFPGVMTMDSLAQWKQAIGRQELSSGYPVFHTLLMRWSRWIWDSPAAMVAACILWMAAVLSAGLTLFYRKGLPAVGLVLFAALFAALPTNGISMVTVQPDVPFMIAFIWLALLLMKLVWDEKGFVRSWPDLLSLFLALALTGLFRRTGVLITGGVAAALIVWALTRRSYALLAPAALSLAAVLIVTGPVYQALKVAPGGSMFLNSSPIQGLGGGAIGGGELPLEARRMMKEIMPLERWGKYYNPYTSETLIFPLDGDPAYRATISKLSEIPSGHFFQLYLNRFKQSPLELARVQAAMTSLLWNLGRPANDVYDIPIIWASGIMQGWEQELGVSGITWRPNTLTILINTAAVITSLRSPLSYVLLWRAGIADALMLAAAFYLIARRRYRSLLVLAPFVVSFATLAASVPVQDSRLIWHHILFAWLLALFAVGSTDYRQRTSI